METRIVIAGGREFSDYSYLKKMAAETIEEKYKNENIVIISGGARGADFLGERFARESGFPVKVFPADWNKYGKLAGPMRNAEMAKYASESKGVLFAFWDGKSSGTKSMINQAQKYGLETHVFRYL